MNDTKQHSIKNTEILINNLATDKEFLRIFENIKIKEKSNNDFITLSDNLKVEYLIKAFLVIKKEKENLFNNFMDYEKESKSLETENLILNNELKLKEEKLIKFKFKIDQLTLDLEEYKLKLNDLTARYREECEEKKKLQDSFSTEKKDYYYYNPMRLEINTKFNKKDIKINKFLNKIIVQPQKNKNIEDSDKNRVNLKEIVKKEQVQKDFSPIINDLNDEFINFQIDKNLNQNDENFIADYIVKSKTNYENDLEHLDIEINRIEANDKIKSNFASQINQSVSIYESVYESYDNRYNIGEYNSSSYQTISSSNKNPSSNKKN